MITLYRAPFSTNVQRVAIALALKGLEVESVVISYEDRSPVVAVSGQGLVPVIEEEGVVIFDSIAILRHLDERYPDPPLFPTDPTRRVEVDAFIEWFERAAQTFSRHCNRQLRWGWNIFTPMSDTGSPLTAVGGTAAVKLELGPRSSRSS